MDISQMHRINSDHFFGKRREKKKNDSLIICTTE